MDRKPVESSTIKSVGYDAEKKELEIEFSSLAVYRYKKVPKEVHDRLMASKSKGGEFMHNIRLVFEFECIYRPPRKAKEERQHGEAETKDESKTPKKARATARA